MDQNFLNSIYSSLGQGLSQDDILKAITAGGSAGWSSTDQGYQVGNQLLKPESLDSTVKVLEYTMKQLVVWNMLPKQSVFNNVHEYLQLVNYGGGTLGVGLQEGETPQAADSQYNRKSVAVKYHGLTGELTQQAMLVRRADGKDPYTAEVENRTMALLRAIEELMTRSNSNNVSEQFDDIFTQHYYGVNEIAGNDKASANLDTYFADPSVIDARGKILQDANIEDAIAGVVDTRFGEVSKLVTHPQVMRDWSASKETFKRFGVNYGSGVTGMDAGQRFAKYTSGAVGEIDMASGTFFDRRSGIAYNRPATSAFSPAVPTIDGVTPIAVQTDTSTKFGDSAGSYFYAVTSKNRFGESQPVMINTVAQAVTAVQSVQLKWGITNNSYPATSYVIYRTEADVADYTTAKLYPILEISVAQLAAGFDGGAALTARDRNRYLPNTHSAIVLDPTSQIWEYLQLASTMRINFAITTLAQRFAVVNYGTPVLYQPGKIGIIYNIGRTAVA